MSIDEAQTKPVTATLGAPVVHTFRRTLSPEAFEASQLPRPSTSALEPLNMAAIPRPLCPNPRKRSLHGPQGPLDQEAPEILPASEGSWTGWKELKSSRADLQSYCAQRGHSLTWETLGRKKENGQDIWIERMTIAGKYQAVGESSARKRAQAAAAEAMIRSGVLEDFADNR